MRPQPHEDACTFVRERMELFLDGELTGSENLFFVTHLKECDDCAAVWADDEELATALLVACAPPPASAEPAFFSADGPRTAGGARRPTEHGATVGLRVVSRGFLAAGAAAAAALLLVFGTGFLLGEEGDVPARPQAKPVVAPVITAAATPLRVRRAAVDHWEPVGVDHEFRPGDQIWAAEGAVSLCRPEGATLGLSEDAVATLREGGAGAAPIFDLHHGRVVADGGTPGCRLRVAEVEIAVQDAACVVEATLQRDTLVVLRGRVDARFADGTSEAVAAGQAVEFSRDGGRLEPVATGADTLAGLVADVERLRRERADLAEDLERARAETAALRLRLAEAERTPAEIEAPGPAATIDALIDRFLVIVDQANVASIERPAPIAIETAKRLTACEGDVLAELRRRLADESVRLRQKALVGLVNLVERPGKRSALEELCFASAPRVRETALFCLSRFPEETAGLGAHFVRVSRREADSSLKFRAAVYAARRGEDEGARVMATLYAKDAEVDGGLRRRIPMYMARLEGDLPSADRFLRCLLLDRGSDKRAVATAIRGLVERADFEAVDVLRAFSERDDVTADLRELAREAIRKLEHFY